MKKTLLILLTAVILCGCTANSTPKKPETPLTYTKEIKDNGDVTCTFSRLPVDKDDLAVLDLGDEYVSASAVILTLGMYGDDPDGCFECLDILMGPESVGPYDKSFIKEQFSQYPYVINSYFDGTSPENDYTPEVFALTFRETPYSRDEEGYVKLYITSSGADSDRGLTLRQKASSGEWFLFSDTYKGLLAGIRLPSSKDAWK